MSACLYVNVRGKAHYKHSYSAGLDYDRSPFLYYLKRIAGYKPKDDKASFLFGRAIEKSIEFYHDHNQGLVEKFLELWEPAKTVEGLVYTKVEKNWESLKRSGVELLRLYEIKRPLFPIPLGGSSVFQREYSKVVFPNDPEFGQLEDAGKLDIVCYVDPHHPMLPKVEWKPEYGITRPVIVDMKTSAVDYPENPGFAAYDKQLRRYSWLSGIRTVAMLWMKKNGHILSKGISVTLLEAVGSFQAGDEAVVAHIQNAPRPKKPKLNKKTGQLEEAEVKIEILKPGVYIVANDYFIGEMEKAQGRKKNEDGSDGDLDTTKEATERKQRWILENATLVTEDKVTRQRIQFNAGFVSKESAEDAGKIAARQIVQIADSWKHNSWPNDMGVRFPCDDRNDPYFKAFVLNDTNFKQTYFTQANAEELDEIFGDAEPEEDGE